MKYILTIDAGTTSVRAILFDKDKNEISKISQFSFKQIFPKPAWVEHDADEIYKKVVKALKEVCCDVEPKDIFGIGITNQRETTVAFEKNTGKPLCNAIVWQCRRTSKYCNQLKKSDYAKTIQSKTGLIPDAYFSATKIKWLLENNTKVDNALKTKNLLVGTIESYLVYRLTNCKTHVTDVTNASRTMLFNINSLKWDSDLLKFFDIPIEILPSVVDNDQIVGQTNILGETIKIAGLIGDQQSSLFGQGCFEVGQAKNTYGTGCFMLANTGDQVVLSKNGLLSTVAFKIENKITYALEGSVFNAGSTVDWAIKNLALSKDPIKLTKQALKLKTNEGVYLVPAFTGMGAPYWDMDARAIIVGLTRGSDKRHFSRAVLESMAYRTFDVLKVMQKECKMQLKELHVDGGASKNDFLMQFQTDLLQINLARYNKESTCLGAIYLTGLATGAYKNLEQIKSLINPLKTFIPSQNFKDVKPLLEGWYQAVKKCLS